MTLVLRVDPVAAKIEGDLPPETTEAIYNALAYEMDGIEMAKVKFWRSGGQINKFFRHWDGINRLYHKEKQVFPAGCLVEVLDLLTEHGLAYEVVYSHPLYVPERDTKVPTLYDYQREVVEALVARPRASAQVPTAGGKTVIMAELCMRFPDLKILICVPSTYLLHQTQLEVAKFTGEAVGIWGDSEFEDGRIVVSNVQTASHDMPDLKGRTHWPELDEKQQWRADYLAQFQYVIHDEAHLTASDSHRILGYYLRNALMRHGVSGTLRREDGADKLLEGIIGPKVAQIEIETLMAAGKLAALDVEMWEFGHEHQGKQKWKDTVANTLAAVERTRFGIRLGMDMLEQGATRLLYLFRYDEHGKQIYDELQEYTSDCLMINGKASQKKRDAAVAALERGEICALAASTILDIGANIPCVDGLVPLAAGCGWNVLAQRVGRALRTFPGKDRARVRDIYDLDGGHLENQAKQRLQAYCMTYGPERVTLVTTKGKRERMW